MIKSIEIKDYFCDGCSIDTHSRDGFPVFHDSNSKQTFCPECALKRGIISPLDYLELHGIGICSKASYQNKVITGYQRWGRGYRKYYFMVD